MRVALYHNLPPGGALRVLYELVRRSHTEHEYHLYTVDLGQLDGFTYARGRAEQHDLTPYVAHSFRYPVVPATAAPFLAGDPWRLTAPIWMERVQRRIATDIDAGGYDAALVNSCSITHTPALLRHLELPSLHYMHEPRRRSFEAGYRVADHRRPVLQRVAAGCVERALRRADRAAALAADRIACNSYYSAESIQRAYGRDAVVCLLGVDTEVFDLGEPSVPGRLSVVSVGALERVKGHDLVVRALALLAPGQRPALDIAYERCDVSYRDELVALAARGGVELRLHAGISDAELVDLYRSAAATVLAATLEPFGLVPLESMACGTPVVAIREAGYRETVDDGVNGYLVDRSASEMAAAVAKVAGGALGRTREQVRGTVVPRWGWDGAVKRQLEQLAITAEQLAR